VKVGSSILVVAAEMNEDLERNPETRRSRRGRSTPRVVVQLNEMGATSCIAIDASRKYRSPDARGPTLKKIEEMALKYLPGIKDGMTFKDLDLPSGAKLAELANALKVEESEGPLTAEQKMNQSILGDLKWVERVVLKLCLLNHRMSCVSTRSGATFN
jgi:hypothetical protein